MAFRMLSWLDTLLFGLRQVWFDSAQLPERSAIEIVGDGVTVEDNTTSKRTIITIPGVTGAVASVSAVAPLQNTGTATAPIIEMTGVISNTQHGARAGGTLHAVATTGAAGFMSAEDKTKLDGLPDMWVVDVSGEDPIFIDNDDPGHPVVRWDPGSAVLMGGYGFTSCAGLSYDDGGILIEAGTGAVTLTASASIVSNSVAGTEEHRKNGTLVRSDAFDSTGYGEVYAASVNLVASLCTQAASGAGAARTLRAGQGAAGSGGGSFEIRVGDGGTPGTDAPGHFNLCLGTAVSGITGKQRWTNAGGGVLATAGQVSGPYFEIASGAVCTAGIALRSSGGVVAIDVVAATVDGYDGGNLGWTLRGPNGGVGSLNFNGSSIASAEVKASQPTGTGSHPGPPLTVKAADGQNASGGTNNIGGALTLASGAHGTGGTGGEDGDIVLKTGSTTEVTIPADGTGVRFAQDLIAPSLDVASGDLYLGANGAGAVRLAATGIDTHINGPALCSAYVTAQYYAAAEGATAGTTGAQNVDFGACETVYLGQLSGGVTLTVLNAVAGVTYKVIGRQNASGAEMVTWAGTNVGFASGQDAIGTTLDKYTVWTLYGIGANLLLCTNREANINVPS
jgi:hypothetical protein